MKPLGTPPPGGHRSPTHRLRLDVYRLLLLGFILLYIGIFSTLAFDQHLGMRTHKADLGQIDQAVWNSSRGRFLESIKDDFISTRLTDHVEPIFVLISPLLWLWDNVRALLLLQVVAVAVGAWPLYELALGKFNQLLSPRARRQIWQMEPLEQLTRPLALAVAVAYLLAPQLQSAVLTEFHAIPLAVPLILWVFWAVENNRWSQFAVATLLVAGVKEEAALLATALGVWALWRMAVGRMQRRRTHKSGNQGEDVPTLPSRPLFATRPFWIALVITSLSLAWFYLATFVIVPAHALAVYDVAESGYFQRYGALGNSPLDIFTSFFTQPQLVWQIATQPARVDYLLGLLAVFGFTSLLAPEILLLCLPVLLANSLSAYPAQYYGEFHYSAPILPFVAVSAAYGSGRVWRFLGRRASGRSESFQHMPAASAPVMAIAAFFANSFSTLRPLLAMGLSLWLVGWAGTVYVDAGRGPLGGRFDPTPITAHHRLLARFVEQIPDTAAVTATAAIHPHVSHRRYVYQFPLGLEPPGRADWALLDVTTNTDMAPGDLKATVDEMLAGQWGVVDAAGGFLLLRKGATEKTIPDAFYDFARAEAFADGRETGGASNVASIPFGPLTFAGLDLEDWPRWRQTKVTTYWQVEAEFVPGTVRPWLELRTPSGDLRYTYDQITPPALVWYPPQRWQAGETIRIETLWLFLPRFWGAAAGVVHGPNPLAPSARMPLPAADPGAGWLADSSGTLALVAAYTRRSDGEVAALPAPSQANFAQALSQATGLSLSGASGRFQTASGTAVALQAWLPAGPIPRNSPVNLWLRWRPDDPSLLAQYRVFVHLRYDGEIRAQNDGAPRYFVPISAATAAVPDWRQLRPSEGNRADGLRRVVVGLFDPTTGERLPAVDAAGRPTGNEKVVGQIELAAPPVPDQACALIPQTCASHP